MYPFTSKCIIHYYHLQLQTSSEDKRASRTKRSHVSRWNRVLYCGAFRFNFNAILILIRFLLEMGTTHKIFSFYARLYLPEESRPKSSVHEYSELGSRFMAHNIHIREIGEESVDCSWELFDVIDSNRQADHFLIVWTFWVKLGVRVIKSTNFEF